MVKKIHSALSLLLCVLLLVHLVITGHLMTSTIHMRLGFIILGYVLLFVLIAHLLLTFIPMLLNHDGNKKKAYTKLNLKCYIQRISGVAIIALIHPHLKAFVKPDSPLSNGNWTEKLAIAFSNPSMEIVPPEPITMGNIYFFIMMVLLIVFCCVHIIISIPKALVGLGVIVEEKSLARVEKICCVIVSAIGAFGIWGSFTLANFSGLFGGSI